MSVDYKKYYIQKTRVEDIKTFKAPFKGYGGKPGGEYEVRWACRDDANVRHSPKAALKCKYCVTQEERTQYESQERMNRILEEGRERFDELFEKFEQNIKKIFNQL